MLGYLDEIPVCTGYEIDGTVTDRFPTTPAADAGQARVHHAPRLEVRHPGLHRLRRPCLSSAKAYVDFLESRIGYPITLVSTGPKRNEITVRQK